MLRNMLELATSVAWGVGMLAAAGGIITIVAGPVAMITHAPADTRFGQMVSGVFKIMVWGAVIFVGGIALSAWAEELITRF